MFIYISFKWMDIHSKKRLKNRENFLQFFIDEPKVSVVLTVKAELYLNSCQLQHKNTVRRWKFKQFLVQRFLNLTSFTNSKNI